jgi:SAM-dependent methyltransferase
VAGDYAVLAPYYDRIGLAKFAETMTPKMLDVAQRSGWMGRRFLDLGCGTGGCMLWLAGRGYSVTGVDNVPEMMQAAQKVIDEKSLNGSLIEADIRSLEKIGRIDMAMSVGTMNDLDSLRDLEAVFKGMQRILSKDRFFVFTMETIEGLTEMGQAPDRIIHEDRDLIVLSRTRYDFERQVCTIDYDLFEKADAECWRRQQAKRVLKAFPIQAVASLLRRHGFEVLKVLNTRLETLDLAMAGAPEVIFFAKKLE